MRYSVLFATLALGAVMTAGCKKAEQTIDCAGICDRYKDCFESDYDVIKCVDECNDNTGDEEYVERVDDCNSCITDKSCASATFSCATECVGIVP